MAEMILPGTYVTVRDEGLIAPGTVSIRNIGIVGTASKGPTTGDPVLLGSYAQARETFGEYDQYNGPDGERNPNALTLVRALELAYGEGATTVYAVRVAGTNAEPARFDLAGANATVSKFEASSPGSWGNQIKIAVAAADNNLPLTELTTAPGDMTDLTLHRAPLSESTTTVRVVRTTGEVESFVAAAAAVVNSKVAYDAATKKLTFDAADKLTKGDKAYASYQVAKANVSQVTVYVGDPTAGTKYTVADSKYLAQLLRSEEARTGVPPLLRPTGDGAGEETNYEPLTAGVKVLPDRPGTNGEVASSTTYGKGLEKLIESNVHIVVAAGQDADDVGDILKQHVNSAGDETNQRERIAVVGSDNKTVGGLRGVLETQSSDRLIVVAPGLVTTDAAVRPPNNPRVQLAGGYTAAAVAGLLSATSPHVSLTNKTLAASDVVKAFNRSELKDLIGNPEKGNLFMLERRSGVRIVRALTSAGPDRAAFRQITTRRIVDYAVYGVRAASNPYVGKLNNERVRGNLKSTLASFLTEMFEDEMLVDFKLDVTATRAEEIKGQVNVTMILRPTFSIDYIKVTMILQ